MSRLKYVLFTLIIVLPFSVYAFDVNSEECILSEVAESGYSFEQIACKNIVIDSYKYIDFFKDIKTTFNYVDLSNGNFYDLSFLENSEVEVLRVINSSVNFDSFQGNVHNIAFNRSVIVDNDFSGLKNNKYDFEIIYFFECWIEDISTLPVEMINEMLLFEYNLSPFIDLTPLKNYKGKELGLRSIAYCLTDDIISSLNDNGVKLLDDLSEVSVSYEEVLQVYNEIPFDDEDLIVSDPYSLIALSVTSQMDVFNGEKGTLSIPFSDFIYGNGDSYTFAFMTAFFYHLYGLESKIVEVGNVDINSYSPYYVAVVKENGVWNYADTYQLKYTGQIMEVAMGLGWYTVFFPEDYELAQDEYRFILSPNDVFEFDEYVTLVLFDGDYEFVKVDGEMTRAPLKSPEKEGYEFLGWYSDASYTNKVNSYSDVQPNTVLYAKWKDISSNNIEEDRGNELFPNPNTGSFIILSIIVLCMLLTVIVLINNKVFRRVFKI